MQERYNLHLKEGEKRVAWLKEEELLLKRLKAKGGKWEQIAKSFPGRTAAACQVRYCTHVNEVEKRAAGVWSKEDDLLLKRLKGKGQSFGKIAMSFPGRTASGCLNRYYKNKGASHPSKGAARANHRNSNDSSDDDEDNSSNDEDDNEEEAEASEPSAAAPLDDDVLPPVISSSFAALTYYPPPLLPRRQRRKFSSSGARRDEKLINEFVCHVCTRLIFRAQVMRPCGCHVFCEECVPSIENR
jgi:hypothetical protein